MSIAQHFRTRSALITLLLALAPVVAFAASQPTPTAMYGAHGDGTFQPVPDGSAANPINVTGAAGTSGAIGPPGTSGTTAQSIQGVNGGTPVPVTGTFTTTTAGGNGTDDSNAMPAPLTVLATFTVVQPGSYFVQNQSAATIQVIFDNGAGGAISTELLAPGAGAGQQGGDTSPPMTWFTGRIQVAGAAGAQFLARHN